MKRDACFYTSILLITLLMACKSTGKGFGKNDMATLEQLSLGNFNDSANKIVFLTFDVTVIDSAAETYSFKPVSKTFADGLLKKNTVNTTDAPEPGYFYNELLDNKKQAIDIVKTADPLNKLYEFPSDEAGAMGKMIVKKKKASLFLRFQYNSNAKYLGVYKFSSLTKKLKNIYYAELLP